MTIDEGGTFAISRAGQFRPAACFRGSSAAEPACFRASAVAGTDAGSGYTKMCARVHAEVYTEVHAAVHAGVKAGANSTEGRSGGLLSWK